MSSKLGCCTINSKKFCSTTRSRHSPRSTKGSWPRKQWMPRPGLKAVRMPRRRTIGRNDGRETTAEKLEEVERTGTAEHMERYYAEVTADATMAEHDQTSSPDKAAGGQALSMSEMLAELDDHRRQNA